MGGWVLEECGLRLNQASLAGADSELGNKVKNLVFEKFDTSLAQLKLG